MNCKEKSKYWRYIFFSFILKQLYNIKLDSQKIYSVLACFKCSSYWSIWIMKENSWVVSWIAWVGKQIQYSPPSDYVRTNLFQNNSNKQKRFHFLPKELLYPSLSKSFVLSICSRNSMKTQLWVIFANVCTAKYVAGCNHDRFLEDNYCVLFFKLTFLIPILCHTFYSIIWKNMHFGGLKKGYFWWKEKVSKFF